MHTFHDPITGLPVTQLTTGNAMSHHLYLTNPGWFDAGHRLLFGSDRAGKRNLHSVRLGTGELVQHADLPAHGDTIRACCHSQTNTAYIDDGQTLYRVDLLGGGAEPIWRFPDNPNLG